MKIIEQLFEITLVLVLVYLVLSNAFGFSTVVSSFGQAYTSSVKVLQGR